MRTLKITHLYEITKEARHCTDLSSLEKLIANILNIIDFEYYLVGISIPISITRSHSRIIDNYPDTWRNIYDKNNLRDIDPIFLYSIKNHNPVLWSDPCIKVITDRLSSDINIMEEAKKHNLDTGITIPIHSFGGTFGMCSFANPDNQLGDEEMATIASQILAPVIVDCFYNEPGFINPLSEWPDLTHREVECLKWSAEGKSAWEIAKISNCSERTVVFHLANVCEKLNATNKYQAISKAIITGVINS